VSVIKDGGRRNLQEKLRLVET